MPENAHESTGMTLDARKPALLAALPASAFAATLAVDDMTSCSKFDNLAVMRSSASFSTRKSSLARCASNALTAGSGTCTSTTGYSSGKASPQENTAGPGTGAKWKQTGSPTIPVFGKAAAQQALTTSKANGSKAIGAASQTENLPLCKDSCNPHRAQAAFPVKSHRSASSHPTRISVSAQTHTHTHTHTHARSPSSATSWTLRT